MLQTKSKTRTGALTAMKLRLVLLLLASSASLGGCAVDSTGHVYPLEEVASPSGFPFDDPLASCHGLSANCFGGP